MEYRPVFGNKGLKVWRYLLRRDDPTPAPWTEKGRQRIESLNLRMIVSSLISSPIYKVNNKVHITKEKKK